MGQVNLYYLVPESSPSNNWMNSNNSLQDQKKIIHFIKELEGMQKCISLENYTGYYDSKNIRNFLEDFEILEDFYPNPIFKLMRRKIQKWYDWRDDPREEQQDTYRLYGKEISDNSFSEISEHQKKIGHDNFVLLNHYAHNCPTPIQVTINNCITFYNDCVNNVNELIEWFANNRLPTRNFHIIPKHGENRTQKRRWRGRNVSPLRCSRQEAFELLKRAIGDETRVLYNIDNDRDDYIIIFKHEGENPQNLYHGYHVEKDSDEIPNHIKKKLMDDK